ncbi:ATP-dependent Clp protease proteolytic subunit-like isoform X2 [Stegodyphus dumicola]|uniref:ATP-dependent Clp protease proteolytic subunit-like isoform X2 n=1 Tax=Stegodyphus dumicola TaxID=202533 RepID=UPI0015B1A234|nr:ATP-dependent Clp protease proteolytic subunit-like isoform X2 [Stegodyphus dumicola]
MLSSLRAAGKKLLGAYSATVRHENSFHQSSKHFLRIPLAISKDEGKAYDIYSRLLKERIIYVMGDITDDMASVVVAQLFYLQSKSSTEPIHMYINSSGGLVTAGFAIYDTMQYILPPVATWCVGRACSIASILLSAGEHGMRYSLPNSSIMIHQPSGSAWGAVTDVQIHAERLLFHKKQMNSILAKHTKQPTEIIEKHMERVQHMTPEQAKDFGLIDDVLSRSPILEDEKETASVEQ